MIAYSVVNCEQRTPQWYAARIGRLTGSEAHGVMAFAKPPKSAKAPVEPKELADRVNLRVKLVLERLRREPNERGFQSKVMKQGSATEDEARNYYEALTGGVVTVPGFLSGTTDMVGCSLDGWVVESGRVVKIQELKCPLPATHLGYIETGIVPDDYLWQVTHNLWVSGAESCDWMSFDPSFPEGLQGFVVSVKAADVDLAGYDRAARAFLAEVDAKVDELRKRLAA